MGIRAEFRYWRGLGFTVEQRRSGHLRLEKDGIVIFTGATPSDKRARRHALAEWRRRKRAAKERDRLQPAKAH